MQNTQLKNAASAIDEKLSACRFKSLVHGDAKLANFCFSPVGVSVSEVAVAAVDFQYVGGGCGMKDVAYFLGSCLDERQCFEQQDELLDFYFAALTAKVAIIHPAIDARALEAEWRGMYALACTDFTRFLNGWMPGHWKFNGYTKSQAMQAFEQLGLG
jgi:Ser/Thr protein kinase RdoA (MazF antagonist)